mmetsp:Transcript_1028/g.2841  ORF Transcript_1028/g.2841 Transcript_1028/m.2841 type:complete len:109 (-) Transcript_1028:217-543(-)
MRLLGSTSGGLKKTSIMQIFSPWTFRRPSWFGLHAVTLDYFPDFPGLFNATTQLLSQVIDATACLPLPRNPHNPLASSSFRWSVAKPRMDGFLRRTTHLGLLPKSIKH